MIIARCPHCETTFRATPEALASHAGKVRCGECRKVFNALEHQIDSSAVNAASKETVNSAQEAEITASGSFANAIAPPHFLLKADNNTSEAWLSTSESNTAPEASTPGDVQASAENDVSQKTTRQEDAPSATESSPAETPVSIEIQPVEINVDQDATTEASPPVTGVPPPELVAVRDTRDIAGYNKWTEGTLSAPPATFEEPHKSAWLMVTLAVILGLMLIVQAVFYWRVDIAQRWPDLRPWLEEACRAAQCTVPYARDPDQISLEASELQIDPARNLLVLNLTIKNRAPYEQEFPSLELTLTDSRDNVVVRRILGADEWLPESITANKTSANKAFPANNEIAGRLWIDATDTGAVGYRLFVFYP